MEKSPRVFGRHLISMNILKEEIDAYSSRMSKFLTK
jgi:hypothetical protein